MADHLGAYIKHDAVALAATARGPLSNLSFAAKDLFDIAGHATGAGSPDWLASHGPATATASSVTGLLAAGAHMVAKAQTDEMAFSITGQNAHYGTPVNVNAQGRIPGGSSSGSAAAVADFMVPFAFGTQTGGSVIRPATYCGVVGYKASYGALPLYGVKALSHDLDTLGWFCREVADIHLMRAALVNAPLAPETADAKPRVGLCRTHEWYQADQDSRAAVLGAAKCLEKAGAEVVDVDLPTPIDRLLEQQKIVMAQNAARDLAFEYNHHRDLLSSHIIALIEAGMAVDFATYQAALLDAAEGRHKLQSVFREVDVLLCPSAPGEAPEGLGGTGDPVFNRVWTLLGNPCVNLPGHLGGKGLPVGVQAVGALGQDEKLLAHCHWMERRIV